MSSKTDILAFLDAKFNKIKPKKKKVAIKEPASSEPEKIVQTIAKLRAETPTCHVTQQSLYSELVSESEI